MGFQSTRPRGARPYATRRIDGSAMFQSTRPRGARRVMRPEDFVSEMVSIHAPAWGATYIFTAAQRACFKFQSTRPRGARPFARVSFSIFRKFQSTRPRGARLSNLTADAFNDAVSIHAPAWGATSAVS